MKDFSLRFAGAKPYSLTKSLHAMTANAFRWCIPSAADSAFLFIIRSLEKTSSNTDEGAFLITAPKCMLQYLNKLLSTSSVSKHLYI